MIANTNTFERITKTKTSDWSYEKERQESKRKERQHRDMRKNKRDHWQTAE